MQIRIKSCDNTAFDYQVGVNISLCRKISIPALTGTRLLKTIGAFYHPKRPSHSTQAVSLAVCLFALTEAPTCAKMSLVVLDGELAVPCTRNPL